MNDLENAVSSYNNEAIVLNRDLNIVKFNKIFSSKLFYHSEIISTNISSIVHHNFKNIFEQKLKRLFEEGGNNQQSEKIDNVQFYDNFKEI